MTMFKLVYLDIANTYSSMYFPRWV